MPSGTEAGAVPVHRANGLAGAPLGCHCAPLRVSDFAQTAAIQAGIALPSSTEPQAAVATPKNKKAQKSARGQNHSRDQDRYGALSWREVRVDDWAARGYAPRERDYQRGAYGRGGFTPNFW